MIARARDGSEFELAMADAYSGPGDIYAKMHVNSTATWVRGVGIAAVHIASWSRSLHHSMATTRRAIEGCWDAAEVARDVVWPPLIQGHIRT